MRGGVEVGSCRHSCGFLDSVWVPRVIYRIGSDLFEGAVGVCDRGFDRKDYASQNAAPVT